MSEFYKKPNGLTENIYRTSIGWDKEMVFQIRKRNDYYSFLLNGEALGLCKSFSLNTNMLSFHVYDNTKLMVDYVYINKE